MLIAHRGGVLGTKILENTLDAFRRAMACHEVSGIEFDVRNHEGNLVITHDPITENTDCVPSLRSVMQLAQEMKYTGLLNVELKEYGLLTAVESVLRDFPDFLPNILLSSFLHPIIHRAKQIPTFQHCRFGRITACWPLEWKQYIDAPDVWVLRDTSVPPDILEELASIGAGKIFMFTVNNAETVVRYRELGFHVVSDVIPVK
jgi:hypothetical protein